MKVKFSSERAQQNWINLKKKNLKRIWKKKQVESDEAIDGEKLSLLNFDIQVGDSIKFFDLIDQMIFFSLQIIHKNLLKNNFWNKKL